MSWGEQTDIQFVAQGAPGVEAYEWTIAGDFVQARTFVSSENTLSVTQQGCSNGSVSVCALYCQGKKSTPTRVEVGVKPFTAKIEGPDAINASGNCQGEYQVVSLASRTNNYSWQASSGLVITSSDNLHCVAQRSEDESDPFYTQLQFSFEGCGQTNTITKSVRARIEPLFYVYDEKHRALMYSGLKTKTPYYFGSISWPDEDILSYRWTLIRPSTGDPTCRDCRFAPGLGEIYFGKTTESLKTRFTETGYHTLRLQLVDGCGRSVREEKFYVQEGTTFPGLRIFPNPASDQLIVEIDPTSDELQISLYNDKGRRKKSLTVAPQKSRLWVSNIEIPLSDLPEGRYFLHVENGNSVHKEQIWIQR